MSESSEIQKQNRKINILLSIVGVVVVAGIVVGIVLFLHSRQGKQADVAQGQGIIQKVSKIYVLPNEEPVVAQIKDKNKLAKGQTFDGKAQTGDYVLLYSGAKIALLYRDSIHKLVSVTPISAQSAGQPPVSQ
jgi:hypothetical protein